MSVTQDQTIEVSAESHIAAMVNEEQRNDAQTPVANAKSYQARTKDVGTKHRRIRELPLQVRQCPQRGSVQMRDRRCRVFDAKIRAQRDMWWGFGPHTIAYGREGIERSTPKEVRRRN